MRDFNTVCSELVKHLRLSAQNVDGTIWWYDGTLDLLTELLSFVRNESINNTVVKTDIYNIEEVHPNCTVQIWRNSQTGEESIGWWPNE